MATWYSFNTFSYNSREKKITPKSANGKDQDVVENNNLVQTSTGSYSTKRSGRNKLTLGKDEWLAKTANTPAASFLDPDDRWNQQLNLYTPNLQ